MWIGIVLVALVSIGLKAAGPAVLGDRELPPKAAAVIAVLAPALLAALVVTDVAGAGWADADWRVGAGLGAAGLSYLLRAPALVAVAVGVVVAAGLRLL
ncbi:branched-chain amino acid ABC transporter [Amycolatopsis suaedae]|uniref:Branched-chain amino acid ABC transporter n=1 Tax=Amycolatopsis suaedae TaxID=2510978 RepID=A0A4Q7J0W1_9PSEU|nr:branched-chain amino acid ABC transporter [Amycolatopsis suaedae]